MFVEWLRMLRVPCRSLRWPYYNYVDLGFITCHADTYDVYMSNYGKTFHNQ